MSVDSGASLLSILGEVERRAELRLVEGETIDAEPQPNGELNEKNRHAMLPKHDGIKEDIG